MSRKTSSVHDAIQMLRELRQDVNDLQEGRQHEGRVSVVRDITETAQTSETVTATDRPVTVMVWDVDDWGLSHWGSEV